VEPFWIIWIIFGILGIASTFFAYCAAKRRREAMAAQAGQLGFAYERSNPELVRQFAMLGDPFTRGYGRRADNVLTGTWNGRPAVAFDYSYKTRSSGENASTHTHHLGIVCVHSGMNMPSLSVLPEGALTRTIGRLRGDDIQLESEDFNRAFRVTSDNARFATDVLHPRMMQFLLSHGREGLRLVGGQAIWVHGGRFKPPDLPPALAYLGAILDQVPDHVRLSLSGSANPRRG
jgi:hypothetical protein